MTEFWSSRHEEDKYYPCVGPLKGSKTINLQVVKKKPDLRIITKYGTMVLLPKLIHFYTATTMDIEQLANNLINGADELMTPKEIAAMLKITASSVYRIIHEKNITAIKISEGRNSAVRVPKSELKKFIDTLI